MRYIYKVLLVVMFILEGSMSFGKTIDFSEIKLKDIEGKEYSFSQEKKTYLRAWISWCPICLSSLEELDNFSKEEDRIEIVSVVFPGRSGEMKTDEFKKWYNSLGYKNIKVLLDEKGEVETLLRIGAYPTSVFLNEKAEVTEVLPGQLPKSSILRLFGLEEKRVE